MKVIVYRSGKSRKGHNLYEVDLNSLGDHKVSGNHFIFRCPWCTDKESWKLYYNFKIGIGFCFRCESVIITKGALQSKSEVINLSWINFLKMEKYLDISWTDPAIISNDVKVELSKRKYFYGLDAMQKFNLRYFYGVNDELVLVLPNSFPDKLQVDSFQTSILKGQIHGPKYVTYSQTKRIYYLDKLKKSMPLIITEGIFDSIAVSDSLNDEVLACPILGKSLSSHQLKQLYQSLKQVKPSEVIVSLDGDVNRQSKVKVCNQILNIDSSLKTYYIDLPDKLDPEEAVAAGVYKECLSRAQRVYP